MLVYLHFSIFKPQNSGALRGGTASYAQICPSTTPHCISSLTVKSNARVTPANGQAVVDPISPKPSYRPMA